MKRWMAGLVLSAIAAAVTTACSSPSQPARRPAGASPSPTVTVRAIVGEPTPARPVTTSAIRTLPAVALFPQPSPRRDYTVGVPAGWSANDFGDASADALQLLPAPGSLTGIDILPGVAVSDIRFTTMLQACNRQFAQNPFTAPDAISGCIVPAGRAQLADSSRPWSPQEALQAILQLLANGSATYSPPRLTPISADAATFQLSASEGGQTLVASGFIGVAHLPNAILAQPSGEPGVTSIAFVGVCGTTPDQEEQVRTLCPQVLGSFQPGPGFWSNVAQAVERRYEQEEQILLQIGESAAQGFAQRSQIIAQWGASMQQLQMDAFEAIESANLRTGENAIAALGGNTLQQDPDTGHVYSLPSGYGTYCLDAAGSSVVAGHNVVPGVSGCSTILHPWQ